MGTAKTENLKSIITSNPIEFEICVVVTFRRTFADEFCEKMGFVNYQSCSNMDIKLSEHKRICI